MTSPARGSDWTRVDSSPDPAHLVDKLRAVALLPGAKAYKAHGYDSLHLGADACLLDVGCGVGHDAVHLAHRVATNGRVVGVDNSQVMLREAMKNGILANVPVKFVLANAQALPFGDHSFDACRADRLLTYTEHPDRAFGELCRVTRVGGRVSVSESDWGTAVVSSPSIHDEFTDRVLSRLCRHFRDGRMGRRLLGFFRAHGFVDIDVAGHAVTTTDFEFVANNFGLEMMLARLMEEGHATPDEAITWLAALHDMKRQETFCASITVWTISGTRA